jgi:ribosomal protein L44E
MHTPGTYYKASGRFEPKRLTIFILTGILLAVFTGWLYYILCQINPITFLNFIILGLAMFGAAILSTYIVGRCECRSETLNNAIAALLCYIIWSTQWAFFNLYWHYGYSFWGGIFNPLTTLKIIIARGNQVDIYRFPSGGGFQYVWYIIELAGFLLAAKWVADTKAYYCEDCKRYYTHKHSHLLGPEIENFHLLKEMAGEDHRYRFLPQLIFVKKLTAVYAERIPVIKVTLHYCPNCQENNMVSVSSFLQEIDSRNKLATTLIKKEPITVTMYITKETANALQRKFV